VGVIGALALLNHFNPSIYRLSMADESLYLRNGLRFQLESFQNYERFPLHSAWYALLHRFIEDPIRIFKLGGVIQLSLLVLLVAAVAQSLGRVPALAAALALSLLATPVLGLQASPFAQRSALIVLLSGLWICSRMTAPLLRILPLGLAYFVASFARSEFILSFYLLSLLIAAYVLLAQRTKRGFLALGLYGLSVAALSSAMEFPVLAGSNRSLMAFGQHYAVQLEEEGVDIDPWLEWRDAMQESFGASESIQEAMLENPSAFFGHVGWSLRGLGGWARNVHPLSLALLALALGLSVRRTWALIRRLRRGRSARHEGELLLMSGLSLGLLPIVIAVLLVAPRNHYLQQFYILSSIMGALSVGGMLADRGRGAGRWAGLPALAGTLLLFVWVAPKAQVHADRNADLARALRTELAHPEGQTARVFSMFRGFSIYLFDSSKEVYFTHWIPDEMPLDELLRKRRIDYVFLDTLRIKKQRGELRAGLERFVDDPGAMGYSFVMGDKRALVYRCLAPDSDSK